MRQLIGAIKIRSRSENHGKILINNTIFAEIRLALDGQSAGPLAARVPGLPARLVREGGQRSARIDHLDARSRPGGDPPNARVPRCQAFL